MDAVGDAYVAGGTPSPDFPTTPGAFDTVLNGSDAFVTRLDPSGSSLIFSTLLGGAAGDGASAVALAADGNIWVGGSTGSLDFPATGDAFDRTRTKPINTL